MKKITSITVLLLFAITIFNSCSKFEDGPGISLKSKKARLAKTWEIETISDSKGKTLTFSEMMNLDSLSGFEMEISSIKFTFEKDETMEMAIELSVMGGAYNFNSPGTWKFVNETGLETTISGINIGDVSTPAESTTSTYNILRLANKELWLEFTESGATYEIHLIPAE